MNSSPEEFEDLRHLLALKRHEQPPPGYFHYLPDKIAIRIEDDLSRHSTLWEWLVRKFDAQPVLAGAYAFAISGLMLLGFKLSQDLQHETGSDAGLLGSTLDPTSVQPSASLQKIFANPAPLLYFSDLTSTGPVFEEPVAGSAVRAFPSRNNFATAGN